MIKKTEIKNLKLFAEKHDIELERKWQSQNPKNAPLPDGYSVVKIGNELVAARIYEPKYTYVSI